MDPPSEVFNNPDLIKEIRKRSLLAEEYSRWLLNNVFLKESRGRLEGKLLYELNNILCRFLLGWYNHPEQRNEVIKKSDSELKEKRIRRKLPYQILEEKTSVIDVPKVTVKFRLTSKVYHHDKVSIKVEPESKSPRDAVFETVISLSKYEKLLKFADENEIARMLLRYDSMLCKTGQFWGLPPKTWKLYMEKYKVKYEGFACPLNFTLPQFFSLFPDTDSVFGSKGSFLTSILTPGIYAINPPYVESIMLEMSRKVLALLEEQGETTCFILLPNWTDAPSIISLMTSKFCIEKIVLEKGEHFIYDYMEEKHMVAYFGNLVLILSNTRPEIDLDEIKNSFEEKTC